MHWIKKEISKDMFEYWYKTGCSYKELREKFTPNVYTFCHIKKIIDYHLSIRK